MDTIASMRAFVAVAKTGSFSAAAQELDIVPSVATKRVTQLERIVGKTLFHRTTRKVVLSADGEHHLERIIAAIAAHDQALTELRKGVRRLTGPIRIKVSTTLGFLRLNALVRDFAELHPDVDVEVLLLDGPMNPAAEGIDIAITAFPASFDNVADEFLWPLRRSLFASRQYLSAYPRLSQPRELEEHRCLVYQPTGPSWPFLSRNGVMTVTVHPRMSSNDMILLLEAAKTHLGIALLSNYVALPDIQRGSLEVPLPDFPVPDLWIKAMVPLDRLRMPRVNALLQFIRTKGAAADSLDARTIPSTTIKSRKK
jgi:DNA-binding transcriptional LysR family regulator